MKLVIDITGAAWAKEHLSCTLPKLEDLEHYAAKRGLRLCAKPNGALATSLALVFMDHFALKGGSKEAWQAINYFFNTNLDLFDTSKTCPIGYMVCLERPI